MYGGAIKALANGTTLSWRNCMKHALIERLGHCITALLLAFGVRAMLAIDTTNLVADPRHVDFPLSNSAVVGTSSRSQNE